MGVQVWACSSHELSLYSPTDITSSVWHLLCFTKVQYNFNIAKSQAYDSQDHTPLPPASWRIQSSKKSIGNNTLSRERLHHAWNSEPVCCLSWKRPKNNRMLSLSRKREFSKQPCALEQQGITGTLCWWPEWCDVEQHERKAVGILEGPSDNIDNAENLAWN